MRNLKRALSLALASVMLVGMMVVGTSAASFPDVDESDNVEAIEVLNAVEVMVGDNGDFRPDSEVTRYEMAVIMAKLVLGSEKAANYSGTYPFTDVTDAEKEWVEPYLAACYSEGIIAGRTATTFDGQATVNGQEAAAMMLRALGYEDLSKGTDPNVADDWARPVVQKASQVGLFSDVGSNPKMAMTRNQVAQLALNTLEATVVTTERTSQDIQIGDISIPGNMTYNDLKSNKPWAYAIDGDSGDSENTVQLGEKLYEGDLKKSGSDNGVAVGDNDGFGRPSKYEWTLNNKSVYNMTEKASVTFVKKTSEDNVLKAIKGYIFDVDKTKAKVTDKNSLTGKTITVENGTDINSSVKVADAVAALTANGKQVEIFADKDKVVEKIVIITYQVSEVESITSSSNGDVTYKLKGIASKKLYADPDKDNTIVLYGDVAEDDIVTVAMAGTVAHVYPTTSFTGVQTAYSTSKHTVTVDGKAYDVGDGLTNVTFDGSKGGFPNSDDEATFYVDFNNFVVKSDAVATSNDYAIIDSIALVTSGGAKADKRVEANLIFTDGTSEIVDITKINDLEMDSDNVTSGSQVEIAMTNKTMTALVLSTTASNNDALVGAIVDYSEDDDGYELTLRDITSSATGDELVLNNVYDVTADASVKTIIDNGKPAVKNTDGTTIITGRSDTTYVVKTKVSGKDTYNVYTGFAEVPTVKTTAGNGGIVSYTTDKDNKVILIYVDATAGTASNESAGRVLYVSSTNVTNAGSGSDKYYTFTGIVDGEEDVELVTKKTSVTGKLTKKGLLFELTEDDDGYVTDMTPLATGDSKYTKVTLTADAGGNTMGDYTYDDDTLFVVIDPEEHEVVGTTADNVKKDDTAYIKVVGGSTAKDVLAEVVYVIKSVNND